MKPTLLCSLLCILVLASCRKQNNHTVSALPPETDSGAGTIGCMVDNRAFLPYQRPLSLGPRPFFANYQRYGNGYGFVALSVRNDDDDMMLLIRLDSLQLRSDTMYVLGRGKTEAKLEKEGRDYVVRDGKALGGLYVRHWDSTTRVFSGRFWMDGIDTLTGKRVEVREGRFDTRM